MVCFSLCLLFRIKLEAGFEPVEPSLVSRLLLLLEGVELRKARFVSELPKLGDLVCELGVVVAFRLLCCGDGVTASHTAEAGGGVAVSVEGGASAFLRKLLFVPLSFLVQR